MSQVTIEKPVVEAPKQKEPRLFLGIPTGSPKLYSTYYMIAALANLDYSNMEIHWAVTGNLTDAKYNEFRMRLTKLLEAVDWKEGITNQIHYVQLPPERFYRNYGPILENKAVLRDKFLDSGAEYFLLLGGDNPPPRNAVRKLLEANADVAMGTCYQRPGVDPLGVYPLVWRFMYSLDDIDKQNLDVVNREELRLAWLNCPTLMNICYDAGFKRRKVIWNVAGGDGCALIKRKVLETIDWSIEPSKAYNSEDIYFMTLALWYGFTTACLPKLHIPHLASDGLVY